MGQGDSRWDPTWGRGRGGQGRPPFGETVITAWHMARPAVEEALEAIEWEILRARRSGALVVPAGLGRTHMLRIVGERINPVQWESVYVPNPALEFEDLCRLVIGLQDAGRPPADGVGELERRLEALWVGGRSLLLLVDDADAMPEQTVRACLELAERHSPTLIVLLGLRGEPDVDPAGFGADRERFPIVRFDQALDPNEMRAYVRHRLRRSGASTDLVERFDEATLARLHSLSGGVPGRLHALAQVLVETPADAPEEAWPRFLEDERGIIEWLREPDEPPAEPDSSSAPDERDVPVATNAPSDEPPAPNGSSASPDEPQVPNESSASSDEPRAVDVPDAPHAADAPEEAAGDGDVAGVAEDARVAEADQAERAPAREPGGCSPAVDEAGSADAGKPAARGEAQPPASPAGPPRRSSRRSARRRRGLRRLG